LIGREEELAKLRDALDELDRGRGGMVALVGEAGVGKSRLVADLKELALAGPAPPLWLEGRCLDVGMAVSYWPVLALVRGRLRLHDRGRRGRAGRQDRRDAARAGRRGGAGRGAVPGARPAAGQPALGRARAGVAERRARQPRAGTPADVPGDPRHGACT